VFESALVTGAYGFVGRHVAAALAARGVQVTGLGHGSWTREEWRRWGLSEWHVADVSVESLTTYAGMPDLVVHCAGSGSVAFSMSNPAQDCNRTVGSTLAVLEYLRLQRPQARLVMPSSAGVYGLVDQLPIATGAALRPVSPYGVHKQMAEDLCRSYARHFGVRAALVRLFSVFGVGIRKQLLWDACNKLRRGPAAFAGTGDETRDWLHVEDAARLLLAAAEHAGTACPVVKLIAARLGGGASVHFSGQVRSGDPRHYQADIADALAWGWRPQREFVTEVQAYVDWFKADAP
jgi:UDP-glucose 4-epimerase